MSSEDIVDCLVLISYTASFLLSLIVAFRKLPRIHRIFPIVWQIAFLVTFIPMLHGFPREWFFVLVITFIWSVAALISSYFLYRQSVMPAKILAFFQFIQSVSAVLITAVGYIGACWRYYGHVVWNP